MNKITVNDAISYFDEQCPNQYSTEDKVKWLNEIDMRIWQDIIEPRTEELKDYTPYNSNTLNREMLVTQPYTELYRYWLEKSVAFANRETTAFNNAMIMFNTYYDAFFGFYNRNHRIKTQSFYKII